MSQQLKLTIAAPTERVATPPVNPIPKLILTSSSTAKRKLHTVDPEANRNPKTADLEKMPPPRKKPRKKPAPEQQSGARADSGTTESEPESAKAAQPPSGFKITMKAATKRKASDMTAADSDPVEIADATAAAPTNDDGGSQSRVTKNEEPHTAGSQAKKPRRKLPAKKLATTSPPRRRAPARAAPVNDEVKDGLASPKPRPPPILAPVTKNVANKIKQVRGFVETARMKRERSSLDRNEYNEYLIAVPESSVVAAFMRMQVHFEMGRPEDAPLADFEHAIVMRYKHQLTTCEVDCVVIDASKQTRFESRIKEKVAGHGLENVNLLEAELEMFKRDQLKMAGHGASIEEVVAGYQRFYDFFEKAWDKVQAGTEQKSKTTCVGEGNTTRKRSSIGKDKDAAINRDEQAGETNTHGNFEGGHMGACPRPMRAA